MVSPLDRARTVAGYTIISGALCVIAERYMDPELPVKICNYIFGSLALLAGLLLLLGVQKNDRRPVIAWLVLCPVGCAIALAGLIYYIYVIATVDNIASEIGHESFEREFGADLSDVRMGAGILIGGILFHLIAMGVCVVIIVQYLRRHMQPNQNLTGGGFVVVQSEYKE